MAKAKKRKRFKKVAAYRPEKSYDDPAAVTYLKDVYVRAIPQRSNDTIVQNVRGGQVFFDVELKYTTGLRSGDRIAWQGGFIEFNGPPYNEDAADCRCRYLKVAGVWIEPCPEATTAAAKAKAKGECGCG